MSVFARVRLKQNTKLWVDRHTENSTTIGDESIWLAEKQGMWINLRKIGYGISGSYGNGAATMSIKSIDHLIMMTPWCLRDSNLLEDFKTIN